MKTGGGTINLDDQPTVKFKKLKSSGGAISLDEDKPQVKKTT